jgi:hypothetical protein
MSSVRQADFRDFSYPFSKNFLVSVPNRLRWMTLPERAKVTLKNGRYVFDSDGCHGLPGKCPLLALDTIQYGKFLGIPHETAVVEMTYHTGGTATWQYLYILTVESGKPRVIAWLESGSRADQGLTKVQIDRGDLLLEVNDPEKRQGDCCSTGFIRYRFRWYDASFRKVGNPVFGDYPQR